MRADCHIQLDTCTLEWFSINFITKVVFYFAVHIVDVSATPRREFSHETMGSPDRIIRGVECCHVLEQNHEYDCVRKRCVLSILKIICM